ncbi:hypothetical protein [Nitrosopumilus sp.]|nr:hypothetical protein [Nitrosopumilus sp.]MCV0431533.1 hypothetical protein [Nitrosopumilus sp.]
MKCCICQKDMNISEGITELEGKKCHVSCKKQNEIEWRKTKGLERN